MTVMLIAIIWLLALSSFSILIWFFCLQFRSAHMEAKTVNQLWHVLSDEEMQGKIGRMSKSAASSKSPG